MNDILSMYKKQKHQFLHIRSSCLKIGRTTIPQTNTNFLNSVTKLRIFVLKIQNDRQLELKLLCRNYFVYRQTSTTDP